MHLNEWPFAYAVGHRSSTPHPGRPDETGFRHDSLTRQPSHQKHDINTSTLSGQPQYHVDHAQRDLKVKSACSNRWVLEGKNRVETHRCYSANQRHLAGGWQPGSQASSARNLPRGRDDWEEINGRAVDTRTHSGTARTVRLAVLYTQTALR